VRRHITTIAGLLGAVAFVLVNAPSAAASESAPAPAHAEHAADAEHAAADASSHGDEHSNTVDPIHHVIDSRSIEIPWLNAELKREIHLPTFGTYEVAGIEFELAVTKHLVMMWLVSLILIVLIGGVGVKARRGGTPSGVVNLIEVFVVWMRDNVTVPALGPVYGVRYLPYLLSVFFFILFGNLIGLVPYSATMTGNLSVTVALALLSWILIQATAIREAGLGGYLKHLTGGVHPLLWPIMIPVEIVGLFTKPFALAIRLFANMSAGHIVILSLLGLIMTLGNVGVAGIAVPFALFVYLLELLVAFIQAFIFTMLTSVFTGMGVHSRHAEEH